MICRYFRMRNKNKDSLPNISSKYDDDFLFEFNLGPFQFPVQRDYVRDTVKLIFSNLGHLMMRVMNKVGWRGAFKYCACTA